jgi:hypothetical protein
VLEPRGGVLGYRPDASCGLLARAIVFDLPGERGLASLVLAIFLAYPRQQIRIALDR